MSPTNEFGIHISADDEASPVLERVSGTMRRTVRENGGLAASAREATQGFRAMTTGLLQEFNPALAISVDRMASATREARNMTGVLGTLTVGAAAFSIGLGAVLDRQNKLLEAQAALNVAMRSLDTSAPASQLRALASEAEVFEQKFGRLKGLLDATRTKGAFNMLDTFFGVPDQRRIDAAREAARTLVPLDEMRAASEFRSKELAIKEQLLNVDTQRARAAGNVPDAIRTTERMVELIRAQAVEEQKALGIEQARVLAAAKVEQQPQEKIDQIRDEFTLRKKVIEDTAKARVTAETEASKQVQVAITAQQAALGIQRAQAAQALADTERRLTGVQDPAATAARREALAVEGERIAKGLELVGNQKAADAQRVQTQVQLREFDQARVDQNLAELQTLRQIVALGADRVIVLRDGLTIGAVAVKNQEEATRQLDAQIVKETAKKNLLGSQLETSQALVAARQRAIEREQIASATELTAIERAKLGASERRQFDLEALAIDERRRSALEQIKELRDEQGNAIRDPNADLRRQQIEQQAALDRERLEMIRAQSQDVGAGIAKGLQDAEDSMTAFGRSSEQVTHDVTDAISSGLGTAAYAAVTGQWKKFPDFLADIGRQSLQSLTQELGKIATGQIVSAVRSAAQSVFGETPGGGGAASPFAEAARAASGGLDISKATASQRVALQGQGYSLDGNAATPPTTQGIVTENQFTTAPGGYVSGLLNMPLYYRSGQPASQGGQSAFFQYRAGEFGQPGYAGAASPEATATGYTGGAQPGPSAADIAGGAAGLAGAALTTAALIYGVVRPQQQHIPTTADIAIGAAGGALSGAILGLYAAAIFSWTGYGAIAAFAVGAVVGGALGGVGAGKGGGKARKQAARKQRREDGQAILRDMNDAIDAAYDTRSAANAPISRIGTGVTVGGVLARMCQLNLSGAVAGTPWYWPASQIARDADEELKRLGVQPQELSLRRVNWVGELMATWIELGVPLYTGGGAGIVDELTPEERGLFGLGESPLGKGNAVPTYEGLLQRFLQKGRGPLVAFDEQVDTGRPGSAARFTRTTLLPAGDAITEAQGQQLRLPIPPGMTEKQIARLLEDLRRADPDHRIDLVRIDDDFVEVKIGSLAEGGIVRRPTIRLLGEAGPEAVIPLNRPNTEFIDNIAATVLQKLKGEERPMLPAATIARSDQELLFDLVALDRQRDLGFFRAEREGGAAVTLGSFSAGGTFGLRPYINPLLESMTREELAAAVPGTSMEK